MSICSTCRQPIRWAKTLEGKAMPLNPQPELGGNIELVGGVARVVQADPMLPRYTTHFSNCPEAAAHRKGRSR